LTFAGNLAFWGVLWGPVRTLHPLWQGKGAFQKLPGPHRNGVRKMIKGGGLYWAGGLDLTCDCHEQILLFFAPGWLFWAGGLNLTCACHEQFFLFLAPGWLETCTYRVGQNRKCVYIYAVYDCAFVGLARTVFIYIYTVYLQYVCRQGKSPNVRSYTRCVHVELARTIY